MYAIMKKEFLSLFKSFKSIAVVAFFILVTYLVSKFLTNFPLKIGMDSTSPYVFSIRALVILFGFLFGLSLSHDTLNREIESQTIRYLLPRTSRINIILGKFIGIYLFWFISITVSFLIISYFAKEFSYIDYIQMLAYMAYVAGITILLSLVLRRSTYTMFLSAILGIVIPAFSAWTIAPNSKVSFLKYIFPIYYTTLKNGLMLMPFLMALVLLGITLILFKRSDF